MTAERLGGPPLLLALSRSRKGHGYVLETDEYGRYVCPCWKFRRIADCPHVEAAGLRAYEQRRAA